MGVHMQLGGTKMIRQKQQQQQSRKKKTLTWPKQTKIKPHESTMTAYQFNPMGSSMSIYV